MNDKRVPIVSLSNRAAQITLGPIVGNGCVSLFLAFCGGTATLAGCSATTPAFNTPQMNQQSLPARNTSVGSNGTPRSVAEVKLPALEKVATPKGLFTVEPYLQWGNTANGIALCWEVSGDSKPDTWAIETRTGAAGQWKFLTAKPTVKPLAVPDEKAQTLLTATFDGLPPASTFDYRVSRDGKPVFIGRAKTRKGPTDPYRFVVFGDCAADTPGQRHIAYQTAQVKPDFVFITGDIVYDRGRASEYLTKFFPVYNAEKTSMETGAPLLRSTLMLANIGNHDGAYSDFGKWPDALAYFYYWDFPRNGPVIEGNVPKPTGNEPAQKAMQAAASEAFPRTANYSFDYGNSHWTVIDSNYYMNWENKALREWLEKDLQAAQKSTWRFVTFHIPPFHSSKEHREDQWMRVLCPLFEKYKVDVVWNGHVHNYQRSFPMTFAPEGSPNDKGEVKGKWTLDTTFDGVQNTKPNAPLYIVTGGGGAPLYDPDIQQKPSEWQPFTKRYIADTHSLTVVDMDGAKMSVRQISETGKELDKFTLTK